MCIKQGFWPPLEPRNESYFSPPSLVCFTRLMTKVFIFHFDLTLPVAMVKENNRTYRLKYRKCYFGLNFEVLQTVVLKVRYQHS